MTANLQTQDAPVADGETKRVNPEHPHPSALGLLNGLVLVVVAVLFGLLSFAVIGAGLRIGWEFVGDLL